MELFGTNQAGAPIFDGRNYSIWKVRMTHLLGAQGYEVYQSILNSPMVPARRSEWTESERKAAEANRRAKTILLQSLSEPVFASVRICDTAKEIWDKLRSIHEDGECVVDNTEVCHLSGVPVEDRKKDSSECSRSRKAGRHEKQCPEESTSSRSLTYKRKSHHSKITVVESDSEDESEDAPREQQVCKAAGDCKTEESSDEEDAINDRRAKLLIRLKKNVEMRAERSCLIGEVEQLKEERDEAVKEDQQLREQIIQQKVKIEEYIKMLDCVQSEAAAKDQEIELLECRVLTLRQELERSRSSAESSTAVKKDEGSCSEVTELTTLNSASEKLKECLSMQRPASLGKQGIGFKKEEHNQKTNQITFKSHGLETFEVPRKGTKMQNLPSARSNEVPVERRVMPYRFQGHCFYCGIFGHRISECKMSKLHVTAQRRPIAPRLERKAIQQHKVQRSSPVIRKLSNPSRRSEKSFRFQGRCHYCRIVGHMIRDCKKRKLHEAALRRPDPPKPVEARLRNRFQALACEVECHRCHDYGHIARQCLTFLPGQMEAVSQSAIQGKFIRKPAEGVQQHEVKIGSSHKFGLFRKHEEKGVQQRTSIGINSAEKRVQTASNINWYQLMQMSRRKVKVEIANLAEVVLKGSARSPREIADTKSASCLTEESKKQNGEIRLQKRVMAVSGGSRISEAKRSHPLKKNGTAEPLGTSMRTKVLSKMKNEEMRLKKKIMVVSGGSQIFGNDRSLMFRRIGTVESKGQLTGAERRVKLQRLKDQQVTGARWVIKKKPSEDESRTCTSPQEVQKELSSSAQPAPLL